LLTFLEKHLVNGEKIEKENCLDKNDPADIDLIDDLIEDEDDNDEGY
jgi:hypothetical protein